MGTMPLPWPGNGDDNSHCMNSINKERQTSLKPMTPFPPIAMIQVCTDSMMWGTTDSTQLPVSMLLHVESGSSFMCWPFGQPQPPPQFRNTNGFWEHSQWARTSPSARNLDENKRGREWRRATGMKTRHVCGSLLIQRTQTSSTSPGVPF